jgi:hypothetical protein
VLPLYDVDLYEDVLDDEYELLDDELLDDDDLPPLDFNYLTGSATS